jgi:predicted enzyme related to lactoylglutathione lyase
LSTKEKTLLERTAVNGVDLFGFMVADPSRSIAFYRDVLGIAPTMLDEQGRGAEFTLSDGTTFGVWDGKDFGKTSGGCAMFAVDDLDAAVALFRERGAKLSDPTETPVCFMSFGEDPDGNAVVIHKRKIKD